MIESSGSFFNNQKINVAIQDFLEREINQFTCFKYAYTVMNKQDPFEFLCISSYPEEWARIYLDNTYQLVDPVMIFAMNSFAPFQWDENLLIPARVKLKEVFVIAKKYNVINGFTFVLHDASNNLVTLNFLINKDNAGNLANEIRDKEAQLQMLLIKIHSEMMSLYRGVNIDVAQKKDEPGDIFTHREKAVLYWTCMRKTYPEIALIQNIKLDTVKYHMRNIINKLGVCNANQAVRVAHELRLISLIAPE